MELRFLFGAVQEKGYMEDPGFGKDCHENSIIRNYFKEKNCEVPLISFPSAWAAH
jgi:hypothetical protein